MKYCKDCKYAKIGWFEWLTSGYRFAKCTHPASLKLSRWATNTLVTGKCDEHEVFYFCSTLRQYECGQEGKFWEQK